MTYELFDLEEDPGETRNLIDHRRSEARELRSELFAWMKEPKRIPEGGETANQSDETIEAL